MEPVTVVIEPPRCPIRGQIHLPNHKARTLTGGGVVWFMPFFPCHLEGRPIRLKSTVQDLREFWEIECPECRNLWRFAKVDGLDWKWEPINSRTIGGYYDPTSPIDPILVLERLEREARDRDRAA